MLVLHTNKKYMTKTKGSPIAWIIFFVSTFALLAAIFLKWEYLTMIIPFVTTSFVKAMRIM